MRILLVNDYGTPTGGAEVQFIGLQKELRNRGHDVRLFTSSARPTEVASAADYECFGTTSRFRTLLQTANPWAWQRLRQVLNDFQPDVVHVKIFLTQLSPLILPLLRNIPSLCHVVWYRPICPTGTKMLPNGTPCQVRYGKACYSNGCLPLHDWTPLMLQMRLWRQWQHVFDLIVANSTTTKHHLLAEGIEPVDIIWNGVTPRTELVPLAARPTAVFAGRLVWEKGIDTLIRAFGEVAQHIPDAQLLIAGEGPEYATLQALIDAQGLHQQISLLGRLSRDDLERAFASAWVQVVPSRWDEPFGIVAAEAAMRGTAVVASNTGGLVEIIQEDHTGYLVPPDNEEKLANALHKLLGNHDQAEQMGRNGHTVAMTNFNEIRNADQFLERYEMLSQKKYTAGIAPKPAR